MLGIRSTSLVPHNSITYVSIIGAMLQVVFYKFGETFLSDFHFCLFGAPKCGPPRIDMALGRGMRLNSGKGGAVP